MNQAQLIDAIAAASAVTGKANVKEVLEAQAKVVQQALASGEEVTLPGLGKLSVSQRAARMGRNPQNGQAVEIAAKRVPKFTASKVLKDAVA